MVTLKVLFFSCALHKKEKKKKAHAAWLREGEKRKKPSFGTPKGYNIGQSPLLVTFQVLLFYLPFLFCIRKNNNKGCINLGFIKGRITKGA